MSAELTKQIEEALEGISTVELRRSIVQLGMVRDIKEANGRVTLTLSLTPLSASARGSVEQEVRAAVENVPGVKEVVLDVVELPPKETNQVGSVTG